MNVPDTIAQHMPAFDRVKERFLKRISSPISADVIDDDNTFFRVLYRLGYVIPVIAKTLEDISDVAPVEFDGNVESFHFIENLIRSLDSLQRTISTNGNLKILKNQYDTNIPFIWPLVDMAEFEFTGRGLSVNMKNVVVIVNIPRMADSSSVLFEQFLFSVLLPKITEVISVFLPADPEDGTLKGCAFVATPSIMHAKQLVDCIDGFLWPVRGNSAMLLNNPPPDMFLRWQARLFRLYGVQSSLEEETLSKTYSGLSSIHEGRRSTTAPNSSVQPLSFRTLTLPSPIIRGNSRTRQEQLQLQLQEEEKKYGSTHIQQKDRKQEEEDDNKQFYEDNNIRQSYHHHEQQQQFSPSNNIFNHTNIYPSDVKSSSRGDVCLSPVLENSPEVLVLGDVIDELFHEYSDELEVEVEDVTSGTSDAKEIETSSEWLSLWSREFRRRNSDSNSLSSIPIEQLEQQSEEEFQRRPDNVQDRTIYIQSQGNTCDAYSADSKGDEEALGGTPRCSVRKSREDRTPQECKIDNRQTTKSESTTTRPSILLQSVRSWREHLMSLVLSFLSSSSGSGSSGNTESGAGLAIAHLWACADEGLQCSLRCKQNKSSYFSQLLTSEELHIQALLICLDEEDDNDEPPSPITSSGSVDSPRSSRVTQHQRSTSTTMDSSAPPPSSSSYSHRSCTHILKSLIQIIIESRQQNTSSPMDNNSNCNDIIDNSNINNIQSSNYTTSEIRREAMELHALFVSIRSLALVVRVRQLQASLERADRRAKRTCERADRYELRLAEAGDRIDLLETDISYLRTVQTELSRSLDYHKTASERNRVLEGLLGRTEQARIDAEARAKQAEERCRILNRAASLASRRDVRPINSSTATSTQIQSVREDTAWYMDDDLQDDDSTSDLDFPIYPPILESRLIQGTNSHNQSFVRNNSQNTSQNNSHKKTATAPSVEATIITGLEDLKESSLEALDIDTLTNLEETLESTTSRVKRILERKIRDKEKEEQFQKIEKANMERESQSLCCICRDEPKSVLLLPCRHLCVCENCAGISSVNNTTIGVLEKCPVCRGTISQQLKVFA